MTAAVCLTPGPNVMLVVSLGLRRGGPDVVEGVLRPAANVAAPAAAPRVRAAFWQGFTTHLSNPKAVLFWSALLPQFIDPQQGVTLQIVLLGVVGIAIDAVVQLGYGFAAAAASHTSPSGRFQRAVDLAAGMLLTTAGVLLAAQGG